ncbi:MAG: ATP-binding protein [Elusimicrobiota bacterium]
MTTLPEAEGGNPRGGSRRQGRVGAGPADRGQDFHRIFDSLPIPLWEEDFSRLRAALDRLRDDGVTDYRAYFAEHPEFVEAATRMAGVREVNPATLRLFQANTKEELLGSLHKVFLPESYPVFREELVALAEGKTYFEAEAVNGTLTGERVDTLLRLTVPGQPPDFGRVLVSTVDITKRKRAEKALQERTADLNVTNERLHQEAAERQRIARALQAHRASFRSIVERNANGLLVVDGTGVVRFVNPAAESFLAREASTLLGKPFSASWSEEQAEQPIVRENGEPGIAEMRTVPTEWEGKAAHLVTLTDITDHKRLEGEILEVSRREQQRIGQDLHDGLSQHLIGISLMVKVLHQKLASLSSPQANDAAAIKVHVDHAVEQTRVLAKGLYPVDLQAHGLFPTLRELSAYSESLFGVSCVVRREGPADVHDLEKGIHLYRIAQEAIANAAKHGEADEIVVTLAARGDRIVLTVEDNGIGITERSARKGGMGMHIMKYRARMIHASLEFQRRPEGGTSVRCSLRHGREESAIEASHGQREETET